MSRFYLPPDYPRIKIVRSFEELAAGRFEDGVNAMCWERELPGDFGEVVERLSAGEGLAVGITTIGEEQLRMLLANESLSEAGRRAVEVMLKDLRQLSELGLQPQLDAVNGYEPKEQPGPVRTDVCSFHVDSATVEADTWLCTYHGATSELLRNDEAVRKVEVPEIRGELWRMWQEEEADEGKDGMVEGWNADREEERFCEWLNENCYDLHYAPVKGARPVGLGVGNLWRIATEWPGCAVPPCIHRAPEPVMGTDGVGGFKGEVRLLLIS